MMPSKYLYIEYLPRMGLYYFVYIKDGKLETEVSFDNQDWYKNIRD